MRQYHISFGILLIFSIIDFAVTAPVPIQRKPRSEVNVVHTTEHAKTKLGKRGDELDRLLFKLISDSESHSPARPEEPPAFHPSGPTDVPSTSNEPPQVPVASPVHTVPVPGYDTLNTLWLNRYGHRFSDDPLAAHFLRDPPPSGSTDGWMDVEQPVTPIPNEPSQMASPPGHAPPVPGNSPLNNMWLNLYGHRFPDESLPTLPLGTSLGPPRSGPVHGRIVFEKQVPSITLQLAGPVRAPPVPGSDPLDKLWPILYGHHLPDESLAAHPSSGSPSSGPAPGLEGVKQPVPSTPKQASILGHAPPNPDDDESRSFNRWLELHGLRFPDKSLAAPPSWGSPSSGPDPGLEGVEQPVPSIPSKPSQMASPGHGPTVPYNDASNNLWFEPYVHHFPDGSLAAHPSLSSPPSGPAQGWKNIEKPVLSIPNEPPQVASPGHAPTVPYNDALNHLWFDPFAHHLPDDSLAAHSSLSSPPSGPAQGWMDIEKQVLSIPNDPPQVASPGHAPTVPYNDASNNLWFEPYVHHLPDDSLAAHPSLSSPPSGPAPGLEDVEQPIQSIPNEPSQVASPSHAPPVPGDALDNMWFNFNEDRFSDGTLVARPPWASQPPKPSHGWTDVEKPLSFIPDKPPVTSQDHGLMGAHALPSSWPSTESDHEMTMR